MKHILITILYFGFSITCLTQNRTTVFLDSNRVQTDSINAVGIREIVNNNDIYKITDYNLERQKLNYCEYSSIEPMIENGNAIKFSTPDTLYAKGKYKNGKLSGVWYYYSNNLILDSADYSVYSDYEYEKDCNISASDKENNRTIKLKNYISNSLSLYLYKAFFPPARIVDTKKYFEVDIRFTINTDGTISCIEILNSPDKDIDAELIRVLKAFIYRGKVKEPINMSYTYKRQEEVYIIVEDMPAFKGGGVIEFKNYVGSNLIYPQNAIAKNIEGTVIVQFCIDKKGNVTNVKVIRGVHPLLNSEAVRVIKNSPKWTPGRQRGKTVKVQFTMPIVFTLN